jgi:hypothetical protein
MSASQCVIHQILHHLVAEYHPFAEYLGYAEDENYFVVYYQGANGEQHMIVDTQGNIISDTTIGTKRTAEIMVAGAAILSLFMGGQQNR